MLEFLCLSRFEEEGKIGVVEAALSCQSLSSATFESEEGLVRSFEMVQGEGIAFIEMMESLLQICEPSGIAHLQTYALQFLNFLRSPYIVEVRGKGLWIGIELNTQARPFCEKLKQRGVLCKETHASVIRLAPPLIIDKADLEWGLAQIRAVLEETTSAIVEPSASVAEPVGSHHS